MRGLIEVVMLGGTDLCYMCRKYNCHLMIFCLSLNFMEHLSVILPCGWRWHESYTTNLAIIKFT